MLTDISETKTELGQKAADKGAAFIREAIAARGRANIIVATGASQFEMLQALVRQQGIDWGKVVGFHLDEYVGLPITHEASFRKYLKERFVEQLPVPIGKFHYVNGEGDPQAACRELGQVIARHEIDVAFVGIGENGHLAFNDPPADFATDEAYIVVDLDEACRRQQVGEGWFASLADVPTRAISMSIRQIMKSRAIICTVPDARKAQAVHGAIRGKVTPNVPASILQQHAACFMLLDRQSASLL
jgi:glucosamine-6-phosphate deaminase